jgi:hypothetical protein
MNKLLTLCLALLVSPAFAAESPKAETIEGTSVLRVGGDYNVASIEKVGDSAFAIEFKSEKPSGRFDTLRLESDHVHVAVKVGQKIRLSAEILSEKGALAEVAQVVVFLPAADSHVPVWLLSNKARNHELRATKFLEMHDPQTDFTVL